jgi:hypothetical protein
MATFYTAVVSILVATYLFLERKTRPIDGQVSGTLKKSIRLTTQCVALLSIVTALLIALPDSFAIYVFLCMAFMFFVTTYQFIKSKTKHLDWRTFGALKKYIRETQNKWLQGQLAKLRGICNLAVHYVLSQFLHPVRLALYPTRSLILCFLRIVTQCIVLLLIAVALILWAAYLPKPFDLYVLSCLACILIVAIYLFVESKTRTVDGQTYSPLKKGIRQTTQWIVLLLIAAALILGVAYLSNSATSFVLSLLACVFFALYIFTDKKTAIKILKYALGIFILLALVVAVPVVITGALVLLAYFGVGLF